MWQEVWIESPKHEAFLLVVDREGRSILQLHLQLNEQLLQDRKFCPRVTVEVDSDGQCQSCLSILRSPYPHETVPRVA